MENDTKMMCPFRRKDNGDFEPCYGKGCMAYYEWTSYAFPSLSTAGENYKMEQVTNATCKLLFPNSGLNCCNPVI